MSRSKRGSPPKARATEPAPVPLPAKAATPPPPTTTRSFARRVPWVVAALLLVAASLAFWLLREAPGPAPAAAGAAAPIAASNAPPVPAAHASAGFVDNARCIGCHQDAAGQWQQSHHFVAMAAPTAESVRGNFDGATFRHQGTTSRFFRREGKYFVNTDGPDGKLADFEIAYTFGVDPLQQYLIAIPGGRLQPLTIAWDTQKKRWFHLYPHEQAPPGDVMHWTGRYQTGNTMCIACHTTGYEKRYDAQADGFDTRWKEPNVSCQSCHGAGSAHVAWADKQPAGRHGAVASAVAIAVAPAAAPAASAAASGPRYGLTMDFRTRDAGAEVEVCAACHSRRSELTASPKAGEPLLDNFLPARLDAGLYHADGQQRDEVYVYGSFRQSKMYQHGVRCSDCHNPHTAKLKVEGNSVCLQCHQAGANPRFASAAGHYDSPAHHHHTAGSAGAQCVSCHMPSTNYMQVHARPDHSLRIPRPDLAASAASPDACTACHAGKAPAWAAAAIAGWFPNSTHRGPHYGQVLLAARAGAPGADAALAQLAADTARPAIVRATALAELRSWPQGHDAVRLAATRDADAEVRVAAADSMENASTAQRLQALAPLLNDPIRAVRITAARSLSTLDPAGFDAMQRRSFDSALQEYIAAQSVSLDMPGARLNLAVIYQNTGQPDLAEANYLAALHIDPDFTPARANLAQFYAARARPADAERVLTDGLKRVPAQGDLQYSLGLILAEQGRMPEAATALARAAVLLPQRARVRYNWGLALQQTGKPREAERAFLDAQRLDPLDTAAPYALAVLMAQQQRWRDALTAAEQLQRLSPADPQVRRFVEQLRAQAQRGG